MKIRLAGPHDAQLLWQWRNDPLVRQNSFASDPIPWDDHQAWLDRRLASPDTRIYIFEVEGKPVAQVRYERQQGGTAQIGDISVAVDERGKGYGKKILSQTIEMACDELKVEKLIAVVKENNVISLRIFVAAGFDLLGEITEGGATCHQLAYPCRASKKLQPR